MRRRTFIAGLGSAVAWPLAVWAQRPDRVRRIGVLMGGDENDPAAKARFSAFTQALSDLGWADGRNVRIDLRWGGPDNNLLRALARESVGLQPDVIMTISLAATAAVQRETRTIPVVFAGVTDPRRHRHRPRAQPAWREHRRLRQLGSLAGRQVA